MPLRDHFHQHPGRPHSWEELCGQWPAMIVVQLFKLLPVGYFAGPRVHPGSYFEIDVATFEDATHHTPASGGSRNGGVAVASWSPSQPALTVEADLAEPSEYEVLVYDEGRSRRLVAAIEIVSPSNKDRPESRRAFVQKCVSFLKRDVCVSIVDLVTARRANLYLELLKCIGQEEPNGEAVGSAIYAVTCRRRKAGRQILVDNWPFALEIGQPLPTLPLWLTSELAVPLDLEASYEETCKYLRID